MRLIARICGVFNWVHTRADGGQQLETWHAHTNGTRSWPSAMTEASGYACVTAATFDWPDARASWSKPHKYLAGSRSTARDSHPAARVAAASRGVLPFS